jgi:hypothetical protein
MRGGFSRCDDETELPREPLPGQEKKQLPRNCAWMFAHFLPIDCTDAEVQEFFAGIGISLPLENFCVTPNSRDNAACNTAIGIPPKTVAMLVNWAINGARLRGLHGMEVKEPKPKGER